jgi:RHS repeat-associated protein
MNSFAYPLFADGMRAQADEYLDEYRYLRYSYDNLNRLIKEESYETETYSGYGYTTDYTYDLVGNRTERLVTVDNSYGQSILDTCYIYYPGTDKLYQEINHNTDVVCAAVQWDNDKYAYAYAGEGGISYKLPGREKRVGQFAAFVLGLPSIWSKILLIAALILVPVTFFGPVVFGFVSTKFFKSDFDSAYPRTHLSLYHRCMCVLLAYVFLLGPDALQTLSYAASDYSQLSTLAWGKDGTTITYDYDNNGSLTSKTTTEGPDTIEEIFYSYNLQGRLAKVETTPYDAQGQPLDSAVTEYRYNTSGIRVSAYSYDTPDGGQNKFNVTCTDYLIDPSNHTGYAQVSEETTYDDDGQGGWIPTTRIQYTIGDDVISQTESTSTDGGITWIAEDLDGDGINDTEYMLYDGHGSTRELVRHTLLDMDDPPDGVGETPDIVDSYSYDGYGALLQNKVAFEDPLYTPPGTTLKQDTSLLYAGEMFDFDNQHYYNRARWYNPYNGLFNRTDPYAGNRADPQSLHKYLYCHNNPINAIDPGGLQTSVKELNVTMLIRLVVIASLSIDVIQCLQGRPSLSLSLIKLIEFIFIGIGELLSNVAYVVHEAYIAIAAAISSMISKAYEYIKKADAKLRKLGTNYDLVIQTPTPPRLAPRLPARYAPLLGDWLTLQFGGPPGRIAGLCLSNKRTRNPRHEFVIIRFDYHPFPKIPGTPTTSLFVIHWHSSFDPHPRHARNHHEIYRFPPGSI